MANATNSDEKGMHGSQPVPTGPRASRNWQCLVSFLSMLYYIRKCHFHVRKKLCLQNKEWFSSQGLALLE